MGLNSKQVQFTGLARPARFALGPHRARTLGLVAIGVVSAIVEMGALYLVARLATSLTRSEVHLSIPLVLGATDLSVGEASALAMVAVAALLLISVPLAHFSSVLSELSLNHARTEYLDAYLSSSWSVRSQDAEGHVQLMATDYAQRAERLVTQLSTGLVTAAQIVVLAVGSLIIAPTTAGAALAALVLLTFVLRPVSRRSRSGAARYAQVDRGFAGGAAQAARLSQEILAFDVADDVQRGLVSQMRVSARSLRHVRFYQQLVPVVYQCGALAVAVGLALFVTEHAPQDISVFAPLLLLIIRGLAYAKQMQSALQAANEFVPYVDTLATDVDRLRAAPRSGGTAAPSDLRSIDMRSIGFSYVPDAPVLADVNLSLCRGRAVAVVGPSGAGKSTLVQLLLGLREPTVGTIAADGVPIRDIDRATWARLVAFVPQDNKLIRGTVADNIRFFRPRVTDQRVQDAARRAHLEPEILLMSDGYETEIGPGAHDISGGQRQRLGIARALAGDPFLVVLDEPTSALDSRSEQRLRETLERMRADTALLIVAHRETTIDMCDEVIALEPAQPRPPSGETGGRGATDRPLRTGHQA